MELHVLTRREMALAAACKIGDVGQALQLVCHEHAAWNLGPHHLNALLPLAIAAEAKAVRTEVVVGDPAREKILGFGPEFFDFGSDSVIVLLLQWISDDGIVDTGRAGVGHRDTP
jgi:hypothetical protein